MALVRRKVLCHIPAMDYDDLMRRAGEIGAMLGLKPRQVVRKATGNPRLWERMQARQAAIYDTAEKMEALVKKGQSDV